MCEDHMLFSLVKIYQVFAGKLTWYFIGVYIKNGIKGPLTYFLGCVAKDVMVK